MSLLFLDFDGVTHPVFPLPNRTDVENQYFSCMPRIEAVLRDFPEWQIVISSSWREIHPFDAIQDFFSEDIRPRVIGVTPLTSIVVPTYQRYLEIMQFLAKNPASHWIALDDVASIFPPDCPNLILCKDGFWKKEEAALRKAFAKAAVVPSRQVVRKAMR